MTADRKSICLVDNDERSRQLIELSLKKEGYSVTVVAGTLDALVALHKDSFALIVAAKELSDGDGFELLSQCQLDASLADTPFILVTDDAAGDEAAATDGGAIGVIGKPVRVKAVVAMVADALESDVADAPAAAPATSGPELPEDAVFTVEYRSFVATMRELPEEANAAIRMFDGKRTLAEAVSDCDIDDATCRSMIPKLIELGVLSPNESSAAAVNTFVTARVRTGATAVAETDAASRLEAEAREAEEVARRAAEQARRAADEARRKAEEARRRAEEERKRRVEEERQRALQELEELDAEQRELEEKKAAELEAARQEADRLMREAEAKAAALSAEANRKANELDDREQSLIDKRENLTARLAAIGVEAPPPSSGSTQAVDMARDAEREAMEQEESHRTLAFSPGAVTAKINESAVGAEESESSAVSGALSAAAAVAAAASTAGAADTIPPTDVTNPEFADSFFKDSSFYAASDVSGPHDELFAEPERDGIPPIWMAMGMLLLLGIIVVLIQGVGSGPEEPEPETPEAEVTPEPEETEVAEGSADDGSGEEIDEGPTEEELAAAVLEEATTAATDAGLNQADDVEYVAREVAAGVAEAGLTPPEPVVATNNTPREERPRTEDPTPREERPTPAETDADRALEQCSNFASSGDYSATIESCQNAVRVNPRSSDAYTYLGKAHYEVGDIDSAINFLQQAVRLNARNRTALLALGAARQDAGDNAGAREAYERYLEINPDSRYAAEVRSILETL